MRDDERQELKLVRTVVSICTLLLAKDNVYRNTFFTVQVQAHYYQHQTPREISKVSTRLTKQLKKHIEELVLFEYLYGNYLSDKYNLCKSFKLSESLRIGNSVGAKPSATIPNLVI